MQKLEAVSYIHGGMTRFALPSGESYWVSTEEMARALLSGNFTMTTILPINCRVMKITDINGRKKFTVVIERDPIKRPILFEDKEDERRQRKIEVQFPRMAFVIPILEDGENYVASELTMALVIKGPILSLDDKVYHFTGGNIFNDERVCWGGARNWKGPSLVIANEIAQSFYDSPFNRDLRSMNLEDLTRSTEYPISKLGTIGRVIEFVSKGREE